MLGKIFGINSSTATSKKNSLNFQSEINPDIQKLESKLSNIEIDNSKIVNYESYKKHIDSILSKYNDKLSELDLLYQTSQQTGKSKVSYAPTKITKMQVTGKIGNSGVTKLDENSLNSKSTLSYNSLKIEEFTNFGSCRTNNCLSKGKWCYEVKLLTNGLFQIGYCQYITSFKRHEGVGDDSTSYAFDGWRQVKWNNGSTEYGELWEIGDYLGVCIDIDNRKINFYLNGKPLSNLSAFNNIYSGKNIAYFPGISLSKGEKCIFNFGQIPFKYTYTGYNPIDKNISSENNLISVTESIFNILKIKEIEDILCDEDSNLKYNKIIACNKLFNFLVRKSFKDLYVLRLKILPFLFKLSNENVKYFKAFWDNLLFSIRNNEQRVEFISYLFDNITNMLEELSVSGEESINEWLNLIDLTYNIFQVDSIMKIWFLLGSKVQVEHCKNIFNSNCIKFTNQYNYLKKKYNNNFENVNDKIITIIREIEKDFFCKYEKEIDKLENTYTSKLSKLIEFFLNDQRKFTDSSGNLKCLKDLFNELMSKGYGPESIFELFGALGYMENNNLMDLSFYKNVIFNLITLQNDYCIRTKFEDISTDPWINRVTQSSIYYDEIGIGGTISAVSENYIENLKNYERVVNDDFYSSFFHKMIRLENEFLINKLFSSYENVRKNYKHTPFNSVIHIQQGTTELKSCLRYKFYLFNLNIQTRFYILSFYLIKYLLWLINQNIYLIYFIPICFTELPFSLFRILYKLKSKILQDENLRKEINKKCPYFSNDDYIESILNFYFYLFKDSTIANPELKEKLLLKVVFFIGKDITWKLVRKNEIILSNLITGILNNMNNQIYSNYIENMLLKIITPCCFGYDKKDDSLIINLKKYLLTNEKVLYEFLNSFFQLINNEMTTFSMNLSEIYEIYSKNLINNNKEKINILKQAVNSAYTSMNNLLKVLQFIIILCPDLLMDNTNNISFKFLNIIKNLSNRILDQTYFQTLNKISNNDGSIIYKFPVITINNNNKEIKNNISKKEINLIILGFSIIGVFEKIFEIENKTLLQNFLIKISNTFDFVFENFNKFFDFFCDIINKTINNESKNNCIKDFKIRIIKTINGIKNILKFKNKVELTEDEIEKLSEKGKICIFCYENLANAMIEPCEHTACEECLKIYLEQKDTCFVCHGKIESWKVINVDKDI